MGWGIWVTHEERLRVLRELRELDLDSAEFEETMLVLAEALTELDSRAAEQQLEKLRAKLRLVEPPDEPAG
ncbi:MAG TPA: hypothetical protein VH950_19535 [Gaiellaceae bacterium]|jgi:hypothetical protein